MFASTPAAELEILATMFDARSFADGECICTAGEKATEMYVIARGAGRVEVPGSSIITTLRRGDAFGEYGLFGGGARTASVRAESGTLAYVLDYERFQRFLFAFPESLAALMRTTVERLQQHEARVRPDFDAASE